jgi:hypothetical protein
MHWRRSTWALIAWTVLMAVWLVVSVSATASAGGIVGWAVVIVMFVWLVVGLPLAAFWYTRRTTGNARAAQLDPMDRRPPAPH